METVGVRYSPEKGGPTDEVSASTTIHEAVAARSTSARVPADRRHARPRRRGGVPDDAPDAVLVNVARGPVVDTDALVCTSEQPHPRRRARRDRPRAAPRGHPLWGFENVLITPHDAGHTPSYYERLADILAENVRRPSEPAMGRSQEPNRPPSLPAGETSGAGFVHQIRDDGHTEHAAE